MSIFRYGQAPSKAQRLQARAIFLPKDAKLFPTPAGCAVYIYTAHDGSPAAIAFRGSAARPGLHYRFKSDERRQVAIAGFVASVTDAQTRKAARQTEKTAWVNPLQVGNILSTCWGYDQTNVEFYTVTKVSGKRVWIREIAADYEATGFMSGKTWPSMPIRFTGPETMHIAQGRGSSGVSVKIDHHYASLEEGRDHYTSSYA